MGLNSASDHQELAIKFRKRLVILFFKYGFKLQWIFLLAQIQVVFLSNESVHRKLNSHSATTTIVQKTTTSKIRK